MGKFDKMVCIIQGESDPYSVPKSMGIFQVLESPKDITTTSVAQRIIANHDAYLVSIQSFSVFLMDATQNAKRYRINSNDLYR